MKIDEVKQIVDTIVQKNTRKVQLEALKATLDSVTKDGEVEIIVKKVTKGDFAVSVNAEELKKILDKAITEQDTTTEETELKTKVK